MKAAKPSHPLTKPVHPWLSKVALGGGIFLALSLFFAVLYGYPSSSSKVAVGSPTPTFISASTGIPTPNIKTFTSANLGISFTYPGQPMWDGKPVQVKELGNRVYLYAWDSKPEEGKFVEVFSKDPHDSIHEAITKRFLQGYSKQDCLIETYTEPYEPTTYQYADIRVPTTDNDSLTTFFEKSAKCPPDTVSGNGDFHFLMDTAHPNKLLYFKLGQDNVGSGIHVTSGGTDIELTWDESIKFLDAK